MNPNQIALAAAFIGLVATSPQRSLAAVPFPVELLQQEAQFSNHLQFKYNEYANQVAISGDRAVATLYRRADLFVRENGVWRVQGAMTTPEGGDAILSVALEGDTLVLGNAGAPPNSGAGRAYVYVRGTSPGLNAWNVTDKDSFAPSVRYSVDVPPALDAAARTNGWRYRLVARMLDNFDIQGFSMDFLYGDGTNRYGAYLALNPDGNLVAGFLGASPQERILTTNTVGARDYHTHELMFNPTTRMVTYFFDGASNRTWAGQSHTNNGIFWGSDSTNDQGSMNVHQARFEILQSGTVLANYDAGTEGNPVVAPNPVSQGWSQLGTPGDDSPIGPQSPDPATLWQLQGTLAASDGLGGDDFGEHLALSGNTVVVGARFDDDGGAETGSAYVFARDGTNWTQQRKLAPSVRAAGDLFGWSVDIDGETIVVGAPHFIGGGAFPGRAFVFVRTGTNWAQQPPSTALTASDGVAGDRFGSAVAIDGDRVAVGAQQDAHGAATFAGSAYVFERAGVTWGQRVKLMANPIGQFELFGNTIDLKGDTLIVGAAAGPAHYIFTRVSSNQWHQSNRRLYPDNDDPSVSAVAFDGQRFMVGTIEIEGSDGVAHIFSADYSNAAGVKDYVRKSLYYPDAQTAAIPFDPNQSAFRYKHLLYGLDAGRVRARFGLMSSLYGANERQRASEVEDVLLRGLSLNPASASLGGLLLDVYYDRAVAESIFAKLALEDAGRARFGRGISPPSPTGFLIDNELPKYRGVLETNRIALQGHFDLLQRQLLVQQPGLSNSRWAARVLGFSSEYVPSNPTWNALKVLGPPDVYPDYGDKTNAWASASSDGQREFLELGYDTPAPINSVSIYETYNPGAVDKISVRNPNTGLWEEVWSGTAAPAGATSRIFTVTFPLTSFPVDAVRIDINSTNVPSWNEIDAVNISGVVPPVSFTDATFGHRLFQQLVPGRGLMPATYTNASGTSIVTTNTAALTNGMLFTGYKDLVLLFDLLRDYGRTAATLAKLHTGRGSATDLAEARRLVSETQRFTLLQGNLLLGVFPGLDPAAVDPQSGLAPAIAGWRQSLTDLAAVQQILTGDANVLGFAPDFLMLLENFTAGGGPVVFDSFDSFQDILDPLSSFSELGAALDALALADATYGAYNGYEDQLASEFGEVTGASVDRLFQIVGKEPGEPGYDTPQTNVGSEIWQQLQSIEVARVRIQKNQTEISNLNKEVAIERNRASSQAAVVVRYANKQASLTEEIGRINAAQAAANQLTDFFDPEKLASGASIAIALNFGVQTSAELEKGEREAEKERLAGLEQAEIIGIDSGALIKTLLLRMNTLALDSKEAALLLNQELGRLVALYNEQANLERRLAESEQELASRYFADPLHQLRSQHDLLQAGIRFQEAQKWLFFMSRALDYKWNFPMTNYEHPEGGGKFWSASTLFKLRNADELLAFYQAMNSFDFFANRGSAPRQDVFSVREHFLGFRTLDDQGQPAVYVDPITGLSLDAVSAFRTNLLRRPITQGQIQIEFSTVRQLPNRPFFAGPVFNEDGSVFSKGLTLNKIKFMKLRAVGPVAQPVSGKLRYGGTSFIRNIFVGEFDPAVPNRIANEMTAYSTRSWFYNLTRNVWQFRDAYEIENVEVEFNPNPFDLNNPPASNLIIEFKERSVATTGWVLNIPVMPLQIHLLDDIQIYFDYVVSQRDLPQ